MTNEFTVLELIRQHIETLNEKMDFIIEALFEEEMIEEDEEEVRGE
jgi:hypothetical protein